MFGSKQRKIDDLTEALANERYASMQRIGITQVFMLLAEGCQKHPSYRAVRKPTADCEKCRELFTARQLVNSSPVATDLGYTPRTGKRGKSSN
jgi:hypothetical protein